MERSDTRRVVITGAGVVCAAGVDLEPFWTALMDARCFIRPLREFTCPDVPNLMGAEVAHQDLDLACDPEEPNPRRGRATLLALSAARRALEDARPALGSDEVDRAGVIVGTTLGEERQLSDLSEAWLRRGPDGVDAAFITRADNQRMAAAIARRHGFAGPVILNATACASGNAAIAWGYDLVTSGACDVVLAGGADTFTRVPCAGFSRMGALSKSLCRPFDKGRDGVSFGEGAGFVVLEELGRARARGARIYAELAGYGISNDAYHLTAPEPSGEGFARAMKQALLTTGLSPADVDFVSAHGTGTPYNDAGETAAIRAVLGPRAFEIPVTSIKGSVGHTNGAAGSIETVAAALALAKQAVPPTTRLEEPDPAFGAMDFVVGKGRPARIRALLKLAAGFGGFNVCLVLREVRA